MHAKRAIQLKSVLWIFAILLALVTGNTVVKAQGGTPPCIYSPGGNPNANWGFNMIYPNSFPAVAGTKHNAQDFFNTSYTSFEVVAVWSGTITRHVSLETSGGVIEITPDGFEEGDGTYAQYAHLEYSSIAVSLNQHVEAGQPIGTANGSGTISGDPHLHLKIMSNWSPIDPMTITCENWGNYPLPDSGNWSTPTPSNFKKFAEPIGIGIGIGLLIIFLVALITNPSGTVKVVYSGMKFTGKTIKATFRLVVKIGKFIYKVYYWTNSLVMGSDWVTRYKRRKIIILPLWMFFQFSVCMLSLTGGTLLFEKTTPNQRAALVKTFGERIVDLNLTVPKSYSPLDFPEFYKPLEIDSLSPLVLPKVTVIENGSCNGQRLEEILGNTSYLGSVPPEKAHAALNRIMSQITPELEAVYYTAEQKTGVPCEVLAGIHYVEGNNRPTASLVSGRAIGTPEPDAGGRVFSSLLETAIYAGEHLKSKAGGNITNAQQLITALSKYNGGGNSNCQSSYPWNIPYGGCPRLFSGEDDPYAMNWLDAKHSTMYLLYCADYTACQPQQFQRPGSFTVAIWFYHGTSQR